MFASIDVAEAGTFCSEFAVLVNACLFFQSDVSHEPLQLAMSLPSLLDLAGSDFAPWNSCKDRSITHSHMNRYRGRSAKWIRKNRSQAREAVEESMQLIEVTPKRLHVGRKYRCAHK